MLWAFMGANARVGVGCIVALEVIACAFVLTRGSLRCVALAHVTGRPHTRVSVQDESSRVMDGVSILDVTISLSTHPP